MQALVLERAGELSLRDYPIEETLGPTDVRVRIKVVGICGSDVHYYQHGAIGPFVVRAPMILGHEAAGIVEEVGRDVTSLRAGDRVCLEPGIPSAAHRTTRLGMYNLDPGVRFWATPPVHGCLRPTVVHPADLTYRLPETVSLEEGAMVEPLAVGLHAVNKARIQPGDIAVVNGAGPIGLLTALAALAGGCSRVFISDVQQPKLDLAAKLGPVMPVNVGREKLEAVVMAATQGWGADVVFEASGNERAVAGVFKPLRPGGRVVLIGMPGQPVALDVVEAQVKEASIETVFRYAHVFARAVALMASGKLDVKPLITDRYAFADAMAAFRYAAAPRPESVKVQIEL